MVYFVADLAEVTVMRRLVSTAFGAYKLSLPDGVSTSDVQEMASEGNTLGYVADISEERTGGFFRSFTRADVQVDASDKGLETSDVHETLSDLAGRTAGEFFLESEIIDLGPWVPYRDFNVGDIVDVEIWGRVIKLPVTRIEPRVSDNGEIAWSVHVGGQILSDDEARRAANDEVMRAIQRETRERESAVGSVERTASAARDTATAAIREIRDVNGQIQNAVDRARGYTDESSRLLEQSDALKNDMQRLHRDVNGWQTDMIRLHDETLRAQNRAIAANTDATEAANEAIAAERRAGQARDQAIQGNRDAITTLEQADAVISDLADRTAQDSNAAMKLVQELMSQIAELSSKVTRVWVPGEPSEYWAQTGGKYETGGIQAIGPWRGRATYQYEDGGRDNRSYHWDSFTVGSTRKIDELPADVRVVLFTVDASTASHALNAKTGSFTPSRSSWAIASSLRADYQGTIAGSVTVVWSAATYHNDYGVRVRMASGEKAQRVITRLGPLTPLGNGRRSLTISLDDLDAREGERLYVEVYTDAEQSSQRAIESVTTRLANIEE